MSLLYLLVAVVLVLFNGFFVAAEFGMVKMRRTRVRAIARKRGLRGRILARVHDNLDAYLSACQLGITLASLGLGWIGEPAVADLVRPVIQAAGVTSENVLHGVAFGIAFFAISYLHIVVGELAPKSIAIRVTESIALWTALPLYGFYWAMYPAIWLLNVSSNLILRLIGLNPARAQEHHYSSEELKMILRSTRSTGRLNRNEWWILAQALDFSELDVADLMRPFHEAATLSVTNTREQNLEIIAGHRFSRYPLLDENGQVLGIVHVKDIFLARQKDQLPQALRKLARPVLMLPPDTPAMELFRRLRRGAAPHFAIIATKSGKPLGFLTLDNLLGALVGEIHDEFRRNDTEWHRSRDGSLKGRGSMPLFSLERALGVDIETEDVDSVGGLIMWKLERLPEPGERVDFGDFSIEVTDMKGPRITGVRVFPAASATTS